MKSDNSSLDNNHSNGITHLCSIYISSLQKNHKYVLVINSLIVLFKMKPNNLLRILLFRLFLFLCLSISRHRTHHHPCNITASEKYIMFILTVSRTYETEKIKIYRGHILEFCIFECPKAVGMSIW